MGSEGPPLSLRKWEWGVGVIERLSEPGLLGSSAAQVTKTSALPILSPTYVNELWAVSRPNAKQKAPAEAPESVTESESEPEVDLNPVRLPHLG